LAHKREFSSSFRRGGYRKSEEKGDLDDGGREGSRAPHDCPAAAAVALFLSAFGSLRLGCSLVEGSMAILRKSGKNRNFSAVDCAISVFALPLFCLLLLRSWWQHTVRNQVAGKAETTPPSSNETRVILKFR
jgi:hypothetical protein